MGCPMESGSPPTPAVLPTCPRGSYKNFSTPSPMARFGAFLIASCQVTAWNDRGGPTPERARRGTAGLCISAYSTT